MKNNNKKATILAAAEEIIWQKGLAETTVSEIARKAGVADSVIYKYFKGKEDLLFSITDQKRKEFMSLLDTHLQGIPDPESRLSKMIWFNLWYNDRNPSYAYILFFECFSSKEFYTSSAYQLIRSFAGVLRAILKRGVEDGHFRPDLDISLMRDIILGTLGCMAILTLAVGEIENSLSDFEDLMSLLHAMITPRKAKELSKSDRILIAAERIFAEKGFTKAKISDIARLANVAEGTVYEYFANKEDLLLSIPEKRFKHYIDELPDVFEIKKPARKLRRFIRYFFSHFFTDRDFLKVFLMHIQLSKRFYGSKAFESYLSYFRVIEDIIEEGKADGSFRSDINTRTFRNMFIGTFNNLALRWFVLKQSSEIDKMQKIDQVTDLLCSAVSDNDEKSLRDKSEEL